MHTDRSPGDPARGRRPPGSNDAEPAGKKKPADRTRADEPSEDGGLDEALEETFPASDPLPPPSTPGTDR